MELNHTDLAMEELHVAASAYYQNAPRELQQLAENVFSSMDMNGDELISYCEFEEFTRQSGCHWIDPNLFQRLDRNGDGSLDFEEFLTLYYIMQARRVRCKGCQVCLLGLYFTCVKCFDEGNTYDLCPVCYRARNFVHHHTFFLDSYLLLRNKIGLSPGAANPNLALVPQPPPPNIPPMAFVPPPPPPYAPPMALVPLPPPPYALPMAIVSQRQLRNVPPMGNWWVPFQALGVALSMWNGLSNCGIM